MHAWQPPVQAGRFMWALLFPNNKAAKPKREECIKLGVMEVSEQPIT
jgi:hypothetical protein